ncbi:helix-turn-helix transcriptional regulator [Aeromicrobium sp. NPDC092404]|uniref:helix-turn-helix transcriptional regulator n=1 Tax=Aeromicrobium sp. NPDC092404 TaxID=3154976 RepID=UPI00343D733F
MSDEPRAGDLLVPLLFLGAVASMVSAGLAQGFWLANMHNGLLSIAFGGVAAWTLLLRPNHHEALLFGVVGVLEGVLYLGRQIAHQTDGAENTWWGWIGVWPLGLILSVITCAVLCFPEGRFLTQGWRRLGIAIVAIGLLCSILSALWPVEYAAAGIELPHPFAIDGIDAATKVWDLMAHAAYAAFQVVWVVGVAARWRKANGILRDQLALLGAAVAITTIALLVGLAVWQSPRLGLLTTPFVPVTAGWIMIRLSLSRVVETTRAAGGLAGLSPRENDVLDLIAQGMSNKAISEHLHLSIKTVEPVVSSIFTKLQLPADATINRRVLAVLARLEE